MDSAIMPGNISFFQQQWELYRRVVEHNYMRHRELGSLLQNWFSENMPRPFSLLDLGCGDASFGLEAVKYAQVTKYVGVDLCAPALQLASDNLAQKDFAHELIESDIAKAPAILKERGEKFDVVLASFSLHHLKLMQKAETLVGLREIIEKGGVFLMIDAVRRKGETREQFYNRYLQNVRESWTALSMTDIQSIEAHITTSDYPETFEILREVGTAAGYQVDRLDLGPNYSDQFLEFTPHAL